ASWPASGPRSWPWPSPTARRPGSSSGSWPVSSPCGPGEAAAGPRPSPSPSPPPSPPSPWPPRWRSSTRGRGGASPPASSVPWPTSGAEGSRTVSTVILRRSGRLAAPPVPEGEVRVPAPPTGLGRVGGPGPFQLLMPVISSGGGLAMMLANPNPMLVLSGSLMAGAGVVTGVGMFVQTRRQGRVQAANTRRRYIAHLAGLRRDLQAAAQAQRAAAAWSHPAPGQLWALAGSRHRLWERRTGDGDFLAVRAGVGRVPLRLEPRLDGATQLVMADPDPACSAAASGLVRRWGSIDGQPCSFPWARSARSSCRGRGREPS